MPKIKVCMLCSNHPALDGRVFYKEARSLQKAGYDVTLLAPLNDEGFLFDMGKNSLASGETTLYNVRIIGFSKKKRVILKTPIISKLIKLASLAILTTGTEPYAERGILKTPIISKLIKLASLAILTTGTEPYAELIDRGTSLKADVYHCHEIWSLCAGIQIKRRLEKEGKKPKLIYDVHEYTPAVSPRYSGIKRLYGRLYKKIIVHFEEKALEYTDYAITVNEAIRNYILAQNKSIPTEVIYNCSVFPIFQKPERGVEHRDKVIICHEGSLAFSRGLKRMIEVMRVLKEGYGNRVELLIIGTVPDAEREYLDLKREEYDLHDNIRYTGWLPYEKVGEAISQADIGIIFFEPTENNMLGTPNKLFNYMRCGLPIVSVDLPETSRIISETQCGLVVTEPNTESLSQALSALIDDETKRRQLGENARKAGYNQYGWEQMEKGLIKVYAELLHPQD